VEDPLQAAQLEVALRRVLLMLHQRAQGAEHAPVVRALRAVPGQHLGELVAHQVARLDREQIAGPPIGGLHAPSGGHQQHAVGRGVEDLAQAVLLEHHRLVVPRVVHRDRGVGREAREQLGFLGRELVSREVVAHQHPEHLVPHADRHREVRAGGGLDEPVVIGLVAQGRIGEPVGRAHRSALLVGASRDPFTRLQDEIANDGGIQVAAPANHEAPARLVVDVDRGGVAAQEVDGLGHDLVSTESRSRVVARWAVIP